MLVVSRLKVPEEPSLMEVGIDPKVNEADPMEVSLTVTLLLVVTTVPVGLPVRTETVKVSGPSLVESERVVILNDPVLLLMVKDPEVAVKSAPVVVT